MLGNGAVAQVAVAQFPGGLLGFVFPEGVPTTLVGGGYDTVVRWVESIGYCLALIWLGS